MIQISRSCNFADSKLDFQILGAWGQRAQENRTTRKSTKLIPWPLRERKVIYIIRVFPRKIFMLCIVGISGLVYFVVLSLLCVWLTVGLSLLIIIIIKNTYIALLSYSTKFNVILGILKVAFHPYVNNLCFVLNLVLSLSVPHLLRYYFLLLSIFFML